MPLATRHEEEGDTGLVGFTVVLDACAQFETFESRFELQAAASFDDAGPTLLVQ